MCAINVILVLFTWTPHCCCNWSVMEILYTEPTSICTVSLVFIWQSFEAYATPMEVILSLSSKRIKGMLDRHHQRHTFSRYRKSTHHIKFQTASQTRSLLAFNHVLFKIFFLVNIYILVINDAYMYSNIFLFDME